MTDTQTWLRRLRPVDDPWVRLVCLPHAGGTASFYRPWRTELPADVELYAVQYPGRLDRIAESCVDDMDTMAVAVADAVEPLLDRPLALFGHSLGAVVAYEVARRLQDRGGRAPACLFASGRAAPDRPRPGTKHLASDSVLWDELRRLNGTKPEVLADPALRRAFLPAVRSDYRLVERYRPRSGPPLRCPVTALVGDRDDDVDLAQARLWGGLTVGEFSVRVFPGDHFYLVEQVPTLVAEILLRLAGELPPRHPEWAGP